MTYLFYGSDYDRVGLYLDGFIEKQFKDEDINLIDYRREEFELKDFVFDICQSGFIFETKVLIADFDDIEKKFKSEPNKDLIDFIKSNDPSVYLIFVNYSDTEPKGVLYEAIDSKNVKKLEPLSEKEWPAYVKKYFDNKKIKITPDAINEIVRRTNYNLRTFLSEVDKLIIYKDNDITIEDVKNIITEYSEEKFYVLSNYLLEKNIEMSLKVFRELQLAKNKVEPVAVINSLAKQLIYLDKISYLKKAGYSREQIASELKVKPGRLYFDFKNIAKYKNDEIAVLLEKLYQLDYKIKHNEVADSVYALEMFILNL